MQARYYDPVTGRFLSPDPIGYQDQPNLYAYVGNDPVNKIDPTGEAIETAWDAAHVAMDVASLGGNLAAGNYGGAAIDAVGLIVDGAATAVPGVPGGAGTAIKAARATDLVGNAQKTFRAGRVATGHAFRSAREAFSMIKSGDYSKVAMNRSLSKITDGAIDSKLRPDVAGIRKDGKIDITEVRSPGQTTKELTAKYQNALGDRAGTINIVEPKVMCTGSRIAQSSC